MKIGIAAISQCIVFLILELKFIVTAYGFYNVVQSKMLHNMQHDLVRFKPKQVENKSHSSCIVELSLFPFSDAKIQCCAHYDATGVKHCWLS